MEFILGLLTGLVFFICLLFAFYLGRRGQNKQIETKPIDEQEKRQKEQFDKHFKALFNYDVSKAVQRKKVK